MTGDQSDMAARLRRLLPPWFGSPEASPVLLALVDGFARVLEAVYALYAFATLQIRLATATGGWLELIGGDFFGDDLTRFPAEPDSQYSRRLRLELLRPRNTRTALERAVFDITGVQPKVYEPFRVQDCGAFGTPLLAYGRVGAYGSDFLVCSAFIAVTMSNTYGIPNRGGWGDGTGGYASGNFSLVDESEIVGTGPTEQDVIKAVERVRSAGVRLFVRFVTLGDPNP